MCFSCVNTFDFKKITTSQQARLLSHSYSRLSVCLIGFCSCFFSAGIKFGMTCRKKKSLRKAHSCGSYFIVHFQLTQVLTNRWQFSHIQPSDLKQHIYCTHGYTEAFKTNKWKGRQMLTFSVKLE